MHRKLDIARALGRERNEHFGGIAEAMRNIAVVQELLAQINGGAVEIADA